MDVIQRTQAIAVLEGPGHQPRARVDAGEDEELAQMVGDRGRTNAQGPGDLLVGGAMQKLGQHVRLPSR